MGWTGIQIAMRDLKITTCHPFLIRLCWWQDSVAAVVYATLELASRTRHEHKVAICHNIAVLSPLWVASTCASYQGLSAVTFMFADGVQTPGKNVYPEENAWGVSLKPTKVLKISKNQDLKEISFSMWK